METSVATLLLVASAVVLACVVVNYTVCVFEQTLNTQNIPELNRIRDLQSEILNQTSSILNQAQNAIPDLPPP